MTSNPLLLSSRQILRHDQQRNLCGVFVGWNISSFFSSLNTVCSLLQPFFFSFSEEKKKQKEELFSDARAFRPLRRSIQGAALKTRKLFIKSLIKNFVNIHVRKHSAKKPMHFYIGFVLFYLIIPSRMEYAASRASAIFVMSRPPEVALSGRPPPLPPVTAATAPRSFPA